MLRADDLLGTWRLLWAHGVDGDAVIDTEPFGPEPHGLIHYLPGRRMAVLIARADRPPLSGGRRNTPAPEWVRAARSFVAYAGSFDVDGDCVVHHVEMNSHPNDVGTDYPRLARLDDDILDLATPADLPADQRAMRLRWRRIAT